MNADHVILVVSSRRQDAENLRGLIEFMDTPNVRTAAPGAWRAELGAARLDALFVGHDLSNTELSALLGEVGELDPNVPIVMLTARANA